MGKVTLVTLNEDWEGIYVDGKLMVEDHILSARQVLTALGIKFQDKETSSDDGNLPDSIKEVKFQRNKDSI